MPKPQLFMLHFAGGNCYSYSFLQPLLKDFDVVAPELPGRGKRWEESLIKDFPSAAADIHRQVKDLISGEPYMLYGHSMGAYLALKVAHLLEMEGLPALQVIVSGNAGPGIPNEDSGWRHRLGRKEFREMLTDLSGEMNDELFDLFEPILRADFQLAERNRLTRETVIDAPLFAMMGSKEPGVEAISNWSGCTTGEFGYAVLEGGHFFIHDHPEKMASIFINCYNSAVAGRSRAGQQVS